eukprot:jgi/Tetstr1/439474/TSEL_027906.t1
MFYSTQILAKKGPLGTIWIAAHLERRLKRHQVFETSITLSVDSIINPEAPLALRLSGQLLLGVVRIYSRKVGYLFQDCNDALLKIKSAFAQTGLVDLPEDQATANLAAITLPENYDNLEVFTDAATGSITLTFEHGEHEEMYDDLAFTVRDESITLDADFNALAFDATPAHDEVFDAGQELDLENIETHSDMEDDQPEQLRSADDGAGEGAALDIGQDLLGSADLQAGGGGSDHDMGDDDYQDDEVVEVVEEDTALGSLATPGAPAAGGTPGQGDTPGLPGADTPGIELGVVDDSPEAAPEAAPELGVGGVVVEEAPWAGGEGEVHAGAARQRSARATEAQVDDGAHGRPATELPGAAIRALLANRAPLLAKRGFRAAFQLPGGAKVDKRRKQIHTQNTMKLPAVPGPLSGPLTELWERANDMAVAARVAAVAADRREAVAAKEAKAARKRAAKQAAAADVPEETAHEAELEEDAPQEDGGAEGAAVDIDLVDGIEEVASEAEYVPDDDGFGDHEVQVVEEPEEGPGEAREEIEVEGEEGGEGEEEEEEEEGLPAAVELMQSGDQEQEQPNANSDAAATTFTSNTRAVLKHVRGLSERAKAKAAEAGQRARPDIVGFSRLVAGKKRLDASRWFFEMLVLKSKDYLDLEQKEPYGDIKIRAGAKLMAAI